MDVRIVLWIEDGTHYRMYVAGSDAPDPSWCKEYQSEIECLVDLCDVLRVPPTEVAEAFTADVDLRKQMLVFGAEVEPAVLRAAGFLERRQEYVN